MMRIQTHLHKITGFSKNFLERTVRRLTSALKRSVTNLQSVTCYQVDTKRILSLRTTRITGNANLRTGTNVTELFIFREASIRPFYTPVTLPITKLRHDSTLEIGPL